MSMLFLNSNPYAPYISHFAQGGYTRSRFSNMSHQHNARTRVGARCHGNGRTRIMFAALVFAGDKDYAQICVRYTDSVRNSF